MKQKINGHTADYLKRQAKNIKKTESISYHDALNKAAIAAGFTCWANFINEGNTLKGKMHLIKSAENLSKLDTTKSKVSLVIHPYRKLLIAAVNELLKQGLISLDGKDFPERDPDGHVFVELFGYPSVVLWSDIGFQELRISVWWKYDHSKHPQANLMGSFKESFSCSTPLAKRQHYRKFVGVVVGAWFERKKSKHLQGKGRRGIFDIYARRGERQALEQISVPEPIGFESEGLVYF